MSTDNARAEAERHYPALNADDEALTYPRSAVREHARGGFVKGYEAGWAAALAAGRAETTTEDARRVVLDAFYDRDGKAILDVYAAGRAETTTEDREYPSCYPSLGEMCGNCHRCTETTTEHEHDWKRQRNVTSRGYELPPIEVCQTEGCDAARPAETTTATLVARRGGKTQALIESLLAQAEDRGLTVEVVYPETTTATTEDAARVLYESGTGFKLTKGKPWEELSESSRDSQRRLAQALADAGLLATARTHAETTTATTEDAVERVFQTTHPAPNTVMGWIRAGYEAGLFATARTRPHRDDLARAIASGYETDDPAPNRHDYRAADAVLALLEGGDDQ